MSTVLDWTAIAARSEMGGLADAWRSLWTFEAGDDVIADDQGASLVRLGNEVWQAIRRYFVDGKEAA